VAKDQLLEARCMNPKTVRWSVGIVSVIGLLALFLFQRINFASILNITDKNLTFIFNKSFRFVVNDGLMIGVIYSLFAKRKFVLFALIVQLAGIVFILMPYFILKLYFHTGNGPLISFLHRLILNPTLMILLIPAFWLQLKNEKSLT
jgi:exosortase F-associated protein